MLQIPLIFPHIIWGKICTSKGNIHYYVFIPINLDVQYTLKGKKIVDKFDNVNPDEVNKSLGLTGNEPSKPTNSNTKGDISSVDTNGNGQVTIKEAKAAGFSMPITSDHWLYPYMHDADKDGLVGE